MIRAGLLRSRLVLQAPVETADGQGGVARTFANVGRVWAKVTLLSSGDGVVANADGATVRARIVVRAPLSLTLQHRFVEDSESIYRITGYRDDGDTIEIDAELRVE